MIKVKKPEIKQNKIHLEQEEKPIVEAIMKISENFHGGDEVTQSVDDQRFALQQAGQEQASQNEENTKEQEEEIQEQGEQNEGQEQTEKQKETQEKQKGQKENEETEQNGEQNEETEREQTGEQGQKQNTEQAKGQEDEEIDESGKEEEEEQEQTEEEEKEENEEENEDAKEEQKEPENEKNSEQAFQINKETAQRLHLTLYKLIEYLSDEQKVLTAEPVSSTQALNIKKLLFRQFERKPLSSYYNYRERTETILILDNSGSMRWLEEVLDTFFAVALKRKDVQVFIAPNGVIEDEYNEKTKKFQEISHEEAMRTIVQTGLPVLYIGDFDGANTPIELSWTNQVYWICTETRYKYFSEHDWVSYNEEQFKGFFGRAWNAEEIVLVIKEFAKHIQQSYFWYDKHKEDEYDNEE